MTSPLDPQRPTTPGEQGPSANPVSADPVSADPVSADPASAGGRQGGIPAGPRTGEGEPGGVALLARMAAPRATKANVLAALLAVALGFAIATQVRQTQTQPLDSLREDELVRILDDVQQDNARLGDEIQSLQTARDRLQGGVANSDDARAAAQERLDSLGILAGTVPATGPGVTIRISDDRGVVTAAVLLDALEELRDAGAEAVQVNDTRIVASSYFTDTAVGGVAVGGTPLRQPYTIRAIGDSGTLASAMDIPGGVSESVRRLGADIVVTPVESVTVDALHSVHEPRYARPVAEPTPPHS